MKIFRPELMQGLYFVLMERRKDRTIARAIPGAEKNSQTQQNMKD